MLILFFIHSFITIFPGSEIVGVPASDINDTIFFDLRISIIFLKFLVSLNLWFDINFDFILY